MAKKMISLEIPDDLREVLRLKAYQEDVSMSEIIRRVLADTFRNELNTDTVKGDK